MQIFSRAEFSFHVKATIFVFCFLLWQQSFGHTIFGAISDYGHINPIIQLTRLVDGPSSFVTENEGGQYLYQKGYKGEVVYAGRKPPNSLLGRQNQTLIEMFSMVQYSFVPRVIQLYEATRKEILSQNPKVVVCDIISYGCIVAANELKKPLIINNPSMAFDLFKDQWWKPFILSKTTPDMGLTTTLKAAMDRIGFILLGYGSLTLHISWHRFSNGRPWLNTFAELTNRDKEIINSFPGLSLSAVSPESVFSGPLIDFSLQSSPTIPKKTPIVLISFGSVQSHYLMNEIITGTKEACQKIHCVVVLSGFGTWINITSEMKDKNVILVVTHGGSNTMHEAIYFGIPLLIFPIYGDQFQNGLTVSRLGLGRMCTNPTFLEVQNSVLELVADNILYSNSKKWSQLAKSVNGSAVCAAVFSLAEGDYKHFQRYENTLPWVICFDITTAIIVFVLLSTFLKKIVSLFIDQIIL